MAIIETKPSRSGHNGLNGASGHAEPEPREPGLLSRLAAAIRYGGSALVRWPIRVFLLLTVVAAGFLPYKYEVGGKCRVVPLRETALRSQLQDEIAAVLVADGDLVAAGQTIATLSAREEHAHLAEAQADVEYAEANLKLVQSGPRDEEIAKAEKMVAMWKSQVEYWGAEYKRQQELVKSQAGSLTAMEKAFSSHSSAEAMLIAATEEEGKLRSGHREETVAAAVAKLNKAKANLKLQEQRMPLTEIRSSIAGTISTPDVQLRVGQTVSPGDMIAVVRDLSTLRVEVLADEAAADAVRNGQEVKVRLWGLYGTLLPGKVERIATMASDKAQLTIDSFRSDRENRQEQIRFQESDNRYVKIVVALDQQDPKLLSGMTGEARVVVGDDYFWNALLRPIERFFLVEVWSWLP